MRPSSGSLSRYLPHAPAVSIVVVTMLLPLVVLIIYGATTTEAGRRVVSLAPAARVLGDSIYWLALA